MPAGGSFWDTSRTSQIRDGDTLYAKPHSGSGESYQGWPFSAFVWSLLDTKREDLLRQHSTLTCPISIPKTNKNQGAGLGLSKQISFKIYLPQTSSNHPHVNPDVEGSNRPTLKPETTAPTLDTSHDVQSKEIKQIRNPALCGLDL